MLRSFFRPSPFQEFGVSICLAFYTNLADNRMLDHSGFSPDDFGYAVFGRVIDGMAVVDRIAAVKTGSAGGMDDVPVDPIVITGAAIRESTVK